MSRFDILTLVERRREDAAYGRYLEARKWQELEWASGLMSPAEFHALSRYVQELQDNYYDAVASGWRRITAEESRLRLLLQRTKHDLEDTVKAFRASVSLARLRMATHRLTSNLLEPAPFRLAYSLTSHGPPRFTASKTETTSG